MLTFALRRLFATIPVLLGVSIVVFAIVRLIPGDPAQILAGEGASLQRIEEIRARFGLDRSLPVQYVEWLRGAVTGDLGTSIRTSRSIRVEIQERLPATVELALAAFALALVAGIPLGLVSAMHKNSFRDYVAMLVSLIGLSMPVFWLGLMLMFIFGVWLGDMPVGGRLASGLAVNRMTGFLTIDSIVASNWRALSSALTHLVLPAIALSSNTLAITARLMRAAAIEVLIEDYIRTARSKGLNPSAVIRKHVLKNALIPVVTMAGVSLGHLLGGAIVTETVFGWPGLGRFLVTAIAARDYPAIQAVVLLSATIFVAVNLIVDLSYGVLNPKIRQDG